MSEKNFVDGMMIKRNPKAPDFVVCNASINLNKFLAYANNNSSDGWLNIDIKQSKKGTYYAELNTWRPDKQQQQPRDNQQGQDGFYKPGPDDEVPF